MAPFHQRGIGKTIIKVRGKRHGDVKEKRRKGERRDPALRTRPSSSGFASDDPLASASTPRLQSRRRTDTYDTPLERLPAEITQLIFEYSSNIDLPLTSRKLAMTLSKSQHLQMKLTTELLSPVLGNAAKFASPSDLAHAARLLNSKFFTWTFFTRWLREQSAQAQDFDDLCQAWSALAPSPNLLPPKKLLIAPFTVEKCQFLTVLSQDLRDIAAQNSLYGELARDGLMQAVKAGNFEIASLLLAMGLQSDTEMLRAAVCDNGCDEDMVRLLVQNLGAECPIPGADGIFTGGTTGLLDPALWAWADKDGNSNGNWLKELLQEHVRRSR